MRYYLLLIMLCVFFCSKKALKESVPDIAQPGEYYEETWPEEDVAPVSAEIKELPLANIYFEFNSYKLTQEAINAIWQFNNVYGPYELRGHACVIGTDEYNLGLSDERAQAVMRCLGSGDVVAYGETRCKALCEDKNELDCKECRKVEIIKIFK